MFDHFSGEGDENVVQEYKERACKWGIWEIWGNVCENRPRVNYEIAKLAVEENIFSWTSFNMLF